VLEVKISYWPENRVYLGAILGLVAAVAFLALSTCNLTGQGLNYDEVHQATAAFAYLPSPPPVAFAAYELAGVPVLNMSYSGAIKTGIFGLYLRLFDQDFSVINWRLTGLLFVSTALVLFGMIIPNNLSPVATATLLLLCLTDATLILASRHDWGPVALSFSLRLVFIAVWIRSELQRALALKGFFTLGLLVGVSVFEKLSSVVLLIPLIMILIPKYRVGKTYVVVAIGLISGAMPLILVNIDSFFRFGTIVSLSEPSVSRSLDVQEFWSHIVSYGSLGNGEVAKAFILGTEPSFLTANLEPVLLWGALILLLAGSMVSTQTRWYRMSLMMLGSYLLIGVVLFIFPLPTWVHHWIMGTPFQYCSIGLGVAAMASAQSASPVRFHAIRAAYLGVVALLASAHLFSSIDLMQSLSRGASATSWDPSLTRLGNFAAAHADESVFIAAEWGTANQIRVFVHGRTDVVYETIWDYGSSAGKSDPSATDVDSGRLLFMRYLPGPEHVLDTVANPRKRFLYLLLKRPRLNWRPEAVQQVVQDVESLPGFREVPVDEEIAEIAGVEIRKFARRESAAEVRSRGNNLPFDLIADGR
jgi:hypothetical protein